MNQASRLAIMACAASCAAASAFAGPPFNLQVGAEMFHETPEAKGGRHSTILGVGITYDISETFHLLG